jgi:hypothetical protein
MVAYLYVIFSLFRVHEYIILKENGLSFTHFGFAAIKALVLAKVMLLGDEIKLGKRLSNQPLVYRIVERSAIFAIFFLGFEFLEQIVRGLFTGKTITEGILEPGGSFFGSLIDTMIMWVMLIPYFAFNEIRLVFGGDNVVRLLFSRQELG